jgi:hypothetical protein
MGAPTVAPVHWIKLESETAELGGDWNKQGTPTYSAAKWNNGQDSSTSNYLYKTLGCDQGTSSWSMYIKAGHNHDDGAAHEWLYDKKLGGYMAFGKSATDKWYITVWDFGSTDSKYYIYYFDIDTVYHTDDTVHLCFLVNDAATANNKIKLWVNGTAQTRSSNTDNGPVSGSGLGVSISGANTPNVILDNLMIFDYLLSTSEIEYLRDNENWASTKRKIITCVF